MDNDKTLRYYIEKILADIEFCINHLENITLEELMEVLK